MPTNVTGEWGAVKYEYDKATNIKEKIRLLEKLISLTPTHKGTERLLAQLRRTLSRLREESTKKKGGRGFSGYAVKIEGAAQVALVGFPSSGKSSLLAALTNAKPEISPVPYTTRIPEVGSMQYLNVQVQLIELPAISPGSPENARWLGIARNADLVILVVDSQQPEQLRLLTDELAQEGIQKPTVVVYTKGDITKKPKAIDLKNQQQLDELKVKVWKELNLIRIYTKTRNAEPDMSRPVTLPVGSTVFDLTKQIHKDFSKNLKYARVWRGKFKGLRAGLDYELKDGDVVELVV